MPLLNIERTTLQNRNNFLYLPDDEELVRLAPPAPFPLSPDLVPLHNNPILTMMTLEKYLGQFKRSKHPFGHLSLLSTLLFVILSTRAMMSSEE